MTGPFLLGREFNQSPVISFLALGTDEEFVVLAHRFLRILSGCDAVKATAGQTRGGSARIARQTEMRIVSQLNVQSDSGQISVQLLRLILRRRKRRVRTLLQVGYLVIRGIISPQHSQLDIFTLHRRDLPKNMAALSAAVQRAEAVDRIQIAIRSTMGNTDKQRIVSGNPAAGLDFCFAGAERCRPGAYAHGERLFQSVLRSDSHHGGTRRVLSR
mgnify:CR=1 FL=1